MKKIKDMTLTFWIFLALVLGVIFGILLSGHADMAEKYILPLGNVFLGLLRFIVVPLVLFSIAAGVISLRDIRKVAAIGGKTILYFLYTTLFAVSVGIAVAFLTKGLFPVLSTQDLSYEPARQVSIMQQMLGIFPSNPIQPLLDFNMLQIIVIAMMLGFGVVYAGEKGGSATRFIESFSEVCLQIMGMILKLAPVGVFCLLVPVIARNGAHVLGSLSLLILIIYLTYIFHMATMLSATVKMLGKVSPIKFFKEMLPVMMFAFSSSSSLGTLPLNREATLKLGAKKEVAEFVLPLGATINMNGTSIYHGACAVFVASCFGIELSLMQMVVIAVTATLSAIGTAGVPGGGLLLLAVVLGSVGLPLEGIALVAGVDRILDMGRTVVNITGDACCALVVSQSAKD